MRRIGASSGESSRNIFQTPRLILCAFLALMACPALRASGITNPPCAVQSLASLIALGNSPSGCTVNGLNYSGFSWTETGGNTTVAASQVTVTPSATPALGLGVLDFSSSSFTVTGSEAIVYTLTYEIDPPPIIIRMFDQDLFDPVTSPGFVNIPTTICLGAAFVSNVCSTSTASVDTFDDGSGGNQLNSSVTFSPQLSTIGVSTVIDIEGGGTGSASITGFSNTTMITPEPASYLLAGLGLAALVWLRSKSARFSSISLRRSD